MSAVTYNGYLQSITFIFILSDDSAKIIFVHLKKAEFMYEGENETYIEASAENSGSTLYDKEIRDKPRTRHTKRNV